MMRALVGEDAESVHKVFVETGVKADLWTGRISATEFYAWMGGQGMRCSVQEAREVVRASLTELPAAGRLEAWARSADVHVLSNHVTEWLQEPFLDRYGPLLGCLAISDRVGARKPEDAIYRYISANVANRGPILYVDDKERNFGPARLLGWDVLLADHDGAWVAEVDALLDGSR
jgi:FMN phosphatase YigB (HAD superfamily)